MKSFQIHARDAGPFLVARRIEGEDLPTVMTYGHGDVVAGYDTQWDNQMSPWHITKDGKRWYGRGTADNKGQHTINIAALKTVLETRGKLGFNVTILIEMGEERGSPGVEGFLRCASEIIQGRCLYRIGRAANPSRQTNHFHGITRGVQFHHAA